MIKFIIIALVTLIPSYFIWKLFSDLNKQHREVRERLADDLRNIARRQAHLRERVEHESKKKKDNGLTFNFLKKK